MCCVQFRLGGYKGVLCVDQRLGGRVLCLRKGSMCKFDSPDRRLEILGHSKPIRGYLNHQVISIMSTLGVRDETFLVLQKKTVRLVFLFSFCSWIPHMDMLRPWIPRRLSGWTRSRQKVVLLNTYTRAHNSWGCYVLAHMHNPTLFIIL